MQVKKNWWKALAVILVFYAIIGGMLFDVPRLDILNESIRNLYYHVTMWFAMMILMTVSLVYSIKNLSSGKWQDDLKAKQFAEAGLVLGLLGIFTGMIWANFTWGAPWVNDPKLNGAAITILIYLAYMILRNAIDEQQKRAKLAAVYSIFAYTMLIVFLLILPRMTASLHPGNGGNPGFSSYDLDSGMRMVFYPAIIGWTLLGVWFANIRIRIGAIEAHLEEEITEGNWSN